MTANAPRWLKFGAWTGCISDVMTREWTPEVNGAVEVAIACTSFVMKQCPAPARPATVSSC